MCRLSQSVWGDKFYGVLPSHAVGWHHRRQSVSAGVVKNWEVSDLADSAQLRHVPRLGQERPHPNQQVRNQQVRSPAVPVLLVPNQQVVHPDLQAVVQDHPLNLVAEDANR